MKMKVFSSSRDSDDILYDPWDPQFEAREVQRTEEEAAEDYDLWLAEGQQE